MADSRTPTCISAAVVALLLLMPAPSVAQEWIEYVNRDDFFGVNLPRDPEIKTISYATEYFVTLPARVYSAEEGPSRFSITVVDYTVARGRHEELIKKCKAEGGDGDFCNDRLATELRGAIIYATWNLLRTHPDATLTHFVYTQADRVEGHELHLAHPDKSSTFAEIFMHENRLYILEGTAPAGSPQLLLFTQSMKFLDKEGKSIRYDTTYSNGFPPPKRAR
jgi:hypothetical protein